MIVGRIGSITALRQVPLPTAPPVKESPRAFASVRAVEPIANGTEQVPSGAVGITFCVSDDEVEVEFYEPRHIVAFASASQLQVK